MTAISGKYDGFDYTGWYAENGDGYIGFQADVSRFGKHLGHVHGRVIHNHAHSPVDIANAVSMGIDSLIDHNRPDWDYDDVREIHESGRHAGTDYRLVVWDNAEGQYFFRAVVLPGLPPRVDSDSAPFHSAADAFAHGHEVARGIIDN